MHITTWKNPTEHTARFRLYRGPGRKPFDAVEIPAGAERQLDGIHDQAIQTTHHGVVTGGLAPQLVRVGEATPKVHTAILDADEAGELERRTAGRRAGAPVSLDQVAEMRARIERIESQADAGMANARKSIEEAQARATVAEGELARLRAQLAEQGAAPATKGPKAPVAKADPTPAT